MGESSGLTWVYHFREEEEKETSQKAWNNPMHHWTQPANRWTQPANR